MNCFAAEIKINKILNLEDPWGSTFINNKELIVTEKFGKIILINIETGELSNIKHDINFLVAVGGFSNSDVLGSAKGWAGSFLYNPRAKKAIDNFYYREDTLSLGVCNGCQLMMELKKIYPMDIDHPKLSYNLSGKFESAFINVTIEPNDSVLLYSFPS